MKLDDKRLEVLKCLLDRSGREWSVSELAEASGVSQPTTSRIVREFEDENVVSSRSKGNMKLVKLDKRSYVKRLVKAVSEKQEGLEDAAEQFVEKLSELEEVEKVLLFGSVARGTADLDSDVDILVIVSDANVRDRIMVKAESVSEETGFHISATVMSVEDYKEHREEDSQFYRSVEQDKVVLYDKPTS